MSGVSPSCGKMGRTRTNPGHLGNALLVPWSMKVRGWSSLNIVRNRAWDCQHGTSDALPLGTMIGTARPGACEDHHAWVDDGTCHPHAQEDYISIADADALPPLYCDLVQVSSMFAEKVAGYRYRQHKLWLINGPLLV